MNNNGILKPRHTSKVTNLKYDNGWHNILHIEDNKYLRKILKEAVPYWSTDKVF